MSNLEPLIVTGELIFLTVEERIRFYVQVCESMGLEPLSDSVLLLQYFWKADRPQRKAQSDPVCFAWCLRSAIKES